MTALFPWYKYGTPLPPVGKPQVALDPWDTLNLTAAKAAGLTALAYQNASGCNQASQNGICSSGVSAQQALANNWVLVDTSGAQIQFVTEKWYYAGDIGDPNYQRAWAANVIELLASGPWDGVFIDDVNPSITGHYLNTAVAKYPSDAAYGAAMGSFVQTVGTLIRDAGKLVVANISNTVKFASVVQPWFANVSGWMDEQNLPVALYWVQGL